MRIHSDRITPADLFTAASIAGVRIDDFSIHGSRTRATALRFYVFGSSYHRPNQRDHGPDDYAATWDEWGILLGHLFSVDPEAHTGRYGYRSAEDFHNKTGHRFVPGFTTPATQHKRHRWEPTYAHESYCECGAVMRWGFAETSPIEASAAVMAVAS